MGHGRWENTGRAAFTVSSAAARKAKTYDSYFINKTITTTLDPKKIKGIRESRDSEQNPESNAIILALDVTGSMGNIAHQIAKDGLGRIIEGILEQKPVTDPHILFSAIGDVKYDHSPLQVSQFEADHRIIEQLTDIYVEGGGGGNSTESYDLPWYFASKMTSIDCFEKRNKKGYLFTFGDELPPDGVTEQQFKKVFKNSPQTGYTAEELLKEVEKKYHVFHVIIEQGHFASHNPAHVINTWKQLMGNRAIPLNNYKYLPEIVLACMHVSEGKNVEEIVHNEQNEEIKETLKHAFGV